MKPALLFAFLATCAPAFGADTALVQAQVVVADGSLPEMLRQEQVLAARRYATFWDTGEARHALAALDPGFVDRTLPPGRAQGVAGPLAASKFVRAAIPSRAGKSRTTGTSRTISP